MENTPAKTNEMQSELVVRLPNEVYNDLKEVASFNKSSLEELAQSYIIDGIASDARIVKHMEFRHHIDEALAKDSFHKKSAKEIINDFNLVY